MNEHGLDARYFKEKLGQLVRDADNYTPIEMQIALSRLAGVAYTQTKKGKAEMEKHCRATWI